MIQLPRELIANIEKLLGKQPDLSAGYKALSERYVSKQRSPFLESDREVLAYIAARLPATYAAIISSCATMKEYVDIQSMTDLGSGPGTALYAFTQLWPDMKRASVIEHHAKLLELNRKLTPIADTTYAQDSLLDKQAYPESDAVVLSYVVNEIAQQKQETVIERAWQATQECLFIIEPGTPVGFQNIIRAREQLIQLGAFIAAPCPHHHKCPLTQDDWCHFSVRVERPYFHRSTKEGHLMYEDEKYTYLIATRKPVVRPHARIIKKPLRRSGHRHIDVCAKDGLKRLTFSKKDKISYKAALQVDWGDAWYEPKEK